MCVCVCARACVRVFIFIYFYGYDDCWLLIGFEEGELWHTIAYLWSIQHKNSTPVSLRLIHLNEFGLDQRERFSKPTMVHNKL